MHKLIILLAVVIVFVQCDQDKNTLITKNQLGMINKHTSIDELDMLFKNDSIEKFPPDSELIYEYRIFTKGGKQLLVIKPMIERDSINGLELVKIYDPAYITDRGISTASTFRDIVDNYSIDKIEPSFTAAILFIDELNATISLNKADLNLDEFDMREIRQDQIPDEAKINYITLWLE